MFAIRTATICARARCSSTAIGSEAKSRFTGRIPKLTVTVQDAK